MASVVISDHLTLKNCLGRHALAAVWLYAVTCPPSPPTQSQVSSVTYVLCQVYSKSLWNEYKHYHPSHHAPPPAHKLPPFSYEPPSPHTHMHIPHSGLFQNPESQVCEPCNSQCLGGCTNGAVRLSEISLAIHHHPLSQLELHYLTVSSLYIPTFSSPTILSLHTLTPSPSQGPEHCNECRNYYIEEMLREGPLVRVCVEVCPLNTYLNTSSRQCVRCYEGCVLGEGCAGPLPILNITHGCLECDRVQLDREENQVSKITCCLYIFVATSNVLVQIPYAYYMYMPSSVHALNWSFKITICMGHISCLQ